MTNQHVNATAITSTSLPGTVNNLIAQRKHWENGTYAASNLELYALIGGCVDLYNAIKGKPNLADGLNEVLTAHSLPYTAHTSLALRVARLVFATPNAAPSTEARVIAYARVIRAAADSGQSSATIAKFIADNHGIEAIRRSGVNSGKPTAAQTVENNRKLARSALADPAATAIFADFQLPDQLKPEPGQRYSLALVRQNPDGTGSIVFGTCQTAAVNAVLAVAGKNMRQEAHTRAEEAIVKQQDKQCEENISALLNELNNTISLAQIAA
jgi:hypothetical protein